MDNQNPTREGSPIEPQGGATQGVTQAATTSIAAPNDEQQDSALSRSVSSTSQRPNPADEEIEFHCICCRRWHEEALGRADTQPPAQDQNQQQATGGDRNDNAAVAQSSTQTTAKTAAPPRRSVKLTRAPTLVQSRAASPVPRPPSYEEVTSAATAHRPNSQQRQQRPCPRQPGRLDREFLLWRITQLENNSACLSSRIDELRSEQSRQGAIARSSVARARRHSSSSPVGHRNCNHGRPRRRSSSPRTRYRGFARGRPISPRRENWTRSVGSPPPLRRRSPRPPRHRQLASPSPSPPRRRIIHRSPTPPRRSIRRPSPVRRTDEAPLAGWSDWEPIQVFSPERQRPTCQPTQARLTNPAPRLVPMGMGIPPALAAAFRNLQTPGISAVSSPAPSLESLPGPATRSPPAHPLSPQANSAPRETRQPGPSTARATNTTPPVLTGIVRIARSAITGSWLVPGLVEARKRLKWLFLRSVLQLKEAPENDDSNVAWDTLENSLVLARLFDSPEDVRAAWHFAFQELPFLHFINLFRQDAAEIRHMVLEIADSE